MSEGLEEDSLRLVEEEDEDDRLLLAKPAVVMARPLTFDAAALVLLHPRPEIKGRLVGKAAEVCHHNNRE